MKVDYPMRRLKGNFVFIDEERTIERNHSAATATALLQQKNRKIHLFVFFIH